MSDKNIQPQPNFYAIIPANVRYCRNLEPNAKLLYGEITALSQKEGYCWASNAYFAELYDVDERTVKRWISSLQEQEFIYIQTEKNGMISQRKIFLFKEMFTKGQKCPPVDSTVKNAPTHSFGRGDKNVPLEGTKMSPNKDISNNKLSVNPRVREENIESFKIIFKGTGPAPSIEVLDLRVAYKILQEEMFSKEEIDEALKIAKENDPKIRPGCALKYLKGIMKKKREEFKKPEKQHNYGKSYGRREKKEQYIPKQSGDNTIMWGGKPFTGTSQKD